MTFWNLFLPRIYSFLVYFYKVLLFLRPVSVIERTKILSDLFWLLDCSCLVSMRGQSLLTSFVLLSTEAMCQHLFRVEEKLRAPGKKVP